MATLVGTQKDLNALLEQLIELDFDAVEAYDAAIQRLHDPQLQDRMREFREDHMRHTRELGGILRQSGREPPQGPDAKRMLTKGKVVLAGLVGDKAVMMAMKTNEEDTNKAYERATTSDVVPPHIKDIVRGCLADERRHRAFIIEQINVM